MRGIIWVLISFLTIVTLALISSFLSTPPEWCTTDLQAGHCEKYQADKFCYCIDEDIQNLTHGQKGVYEAAERSCKKFNGSLAAPELLSLQRWLAKRMYYMGVDNAVIALRKQQTSWYWMRENGSSVAANLLWRKEFAVVDQHSHATLNVETVKNDSTNDGDNDVYLNFDHYLENDATYEWCGMTTFDDVYDYITHVYHICNYTKEPEIEMMKHEETTTVFSNEEDHDRCYCSSNEQIVLSELLTNDTFTSSNYPSNYCSDQSCRWFITAPEGLVVKLKWLVFNTENKMDWVYIYDGRSTSDAMLAKCSGPRCSDQISSGRHMQVHFNADHVITDLGFKARVAAIEPDPCFCSESASVYLSNLEDSFILSSPQHPQPYCINLQCSWTIHAPKDLGLHIEWDRFETEHSHDFLHIYDGLTNGDALLRECTGDTCTQVTGNAEQVHIKFRSDPHSSKHTGFKGLVTVVHNHCDVKDLYVPLGFLTVSEMRPDEFVPAGAAATLHCPVNTTLTTGLKLKINESVTCIAPHWERELQICEPLCEPKIIASESSGDFHVCSLGVMYDGLTTSATVQHYDYIIETFHPSKTQHFCSKGSIWVPEPPLCHVGGILIIGGMEVDGNTPRMEFYSPFDKTTILVDGDRRIWKEHTAQVLPNAQLMIMGGAHHVEFNVDGFLAFTSSIDQKSVSIYSEGNLVVSRYRAQSAVLNGTVYICLGQDWMFDTCEFFENGWWHMLKARLNLKRTEAAMVALEDSLYIIGGDARSDNFFVDKLGDYALNSVEKYSLSDPRWRLVGPMNKARRNLAAASLNGFMYACGGEFIVDGKEQWTPFCEQYDPNQNMWTIVAEMNVPRSNFYLLSFLGKLYGIGGSKVVYNQIGFPMNVYSLKSIEVYNPTFDKWEMQEEQLTRGSAYGAAVVVPFVPHKYEGDENKKKKNIHPWLMPFYRYGYY